MGGVAGGLEAVRSCAGRQSQVAKGLGPLAYLC